MTGHDNGIITLNLAEGDDVHREQLRVERTSRTDPARPLGHESAHITG
jgi:hypothetical protein